MSAGTLWVTPSGVGKALRSTAAYGGIKIDIPTDYKHFEDNKKPEFLSKFPLGKIPAWEGADGFRLTETIAIARYIASLAPNSTLLGSSPKESALVDQWLSFAVTEIQATTGIVNYLVKGLVQPYNKGIHTANVENQTRSLKMLNAHLLTQTFLVGERITVADFVLCGALSFAFSVTFDAPLRKELSNIVRYFETVTGHPSAKDIFVNTVFVEKALQYTPPKKEEKPKEKPKKEEKKPASKKKDDDDEEEEESYDEPKPKNPLDSLPKSEFNLEDWKRYYSNNDVRGPGGSLEWFYNKFDKEGFSVWRVDYKYGNELTEVFMSSNLIRGFFTRLEASRKYLFGYLCVLGVKNDSLISGVFICRGQDIKPVVEVAPDWESYDFKRIDFNSDLDKTFFEQAMAEELQLEGKKWADGKSFK